MIKWRLYYSLKIIGFILCSRFLSEKIYIYSYVIPVTVLLVLIAHRMYKTWIIIRYSVALQVDYKVKEKMRQARLLQYYLYVKITLLLTLTYIFGVIARLTHYNWAWISFNVEHSLQGLLVAIAVTCNCHILKIFAKSIKRRRRKRENLIDICKFKKRNRDISRSTSLDTLSWEPELLSVWFGQIYQIHGIETVGTLGWYERLAMER